LYIGDRSILEEGSHDELLDKKGLYHHLYTAQSQEQGMILEPAGV
jgi:ABC-type multidrug transport system fused ATPase/permease subunit